MGELGICWNSLLLSVVHRCRFNVARSGEGYITDFDHILKQLLHFNFFLLHFRVLFVYCHLIPLRKSKNATATLVCLV